MERRAEGENERGGERGSEWRERLLFTVSGLLLFETLSGLAMWLLPFSVPNQIGVLLHTLVGLVFLVPYLLYQLRHWRRYRRMPLSHVVLTGYFAMAACGVAALSGLVLTWQALFRARIGYGWDLAHIVATLALIAAAVPHVGVLLLRTRRAREREAVRPLREGQRRFAWRTSLVALGLIAAGAVLAWAYRPVELHDELPEDYSFLYGPDRPFAPSLATTTTGGAFDARSLGGSESCGTAGCHEEILREWQVSSHRWSAMDPAFQAVQNVMAEQNGPESTRYCGGCHDPISLFSGAKNVFAEDLTNHTGYQEGVSCVVCHAIRETDIKGNANYVIAQPDRYLFELREDPRSRLVRDFLIRAYPRHHVQSLSHRLFKSPEFCAACHKQFIDEEINQVGWVQLQNQYDNWRKSRWNHPGDPTKTIECRECHMPLQDSADPGGGDDLDYNRSAGDGKHRSHRFLAANQMVPELLDLPGAEEHVRLTQRWLRGEIEIPEIADKWRAGPAIPVELVVPEEVEVGEEVRIRAVVTNNKVGHDFPTGPLDIIQAWLELRVTDQAGRVVYETGATDPAHFIREGSFIFKAEPVDQYGNLIDRHNLWEMVGVRYKRAVFPGFSDQAEFAFLCPATVLPGPAAADGRGAVVPAAGEPGAAPRTRAAPGAAEVGPSERPVSREGPEEPRAEEHAFRAPPGAAGSLHVTVKLLYRKFDQFLLNFLFGEEAGITAPVTVLSEDEATIRVRARRQDAR
ncbi:MAG: multiheme c-type cytochrome [Gemmatimonadota bacterium]